ncbi:MAG: ABC transporter substrate-binding protein [Deltaproteobacteria bacterium]|nr:ABC transporter substrate-binding protein [Deltaproteobacteria bacterium]
MRNSIFAILGLAILGGFLPGCERSQEKAPPDKVTVQLKWFHQAQFAGFYLAKEKGYYARENLDVTFLEGGKGVDGIDRVISGRADFAVVSPEDVLMKTSQGVPVEAIAVIYQRSAVVFITKKESGIERPFDFAEKTVAVGGAPGSIRDFQIQFNALIKKLKIDDTAITIVPHEPSHKGFIKGDADVTAVYITGGFITLKKEGHNLIVIWPGDYGIHFYSDTLVAGKALIEKNPQLVARFLRATLKGWREAVGDADAAVGATMKYARVQDEALQKAMMEAQLPLVHTGEHPIGWMREEQWREMRETLQEQGVISASPSNGTETYTMRFLETVYGGQKE